MGERTKAAGADRLDQFAGAAFFQAQRHQRRVLPEVADRARHQRVERGRAGEADAEPAGLAAGGAASGIARHLDPGEDRARLGEKRLARRRQGDSARQPP
jgi:hypothetical protein